MTKIRNSKQYDLEDRTFEFAKRVRAFVKKLPKTITNFEDQNLQKGIKRESILVEIS